MLIDLQAMLAKIETTYGTDSAPAAATNAILAQNVKISPFEANEITRQHAMPYQGARPSLLVGKHVKISFEVELKGSGTAGTAPAFGVLMRSCKCAEVIVAATSVTYNPVSSNHESCSLYFHVDGTLYKVIGARGDWKMKLNANGVAVLEFTMTGKFTLPSTAAVPTATYGTQLSLDPQPGSSVNTPTFTIGAYAPVLRNFTFSARNQVKPRFLIRSESVVITGSDELVEFQIEAVGLATFNPYALADAGTKSALTLVHGVGAGKIATLSVPSLQLLAPGGLDDVDGVVENQIKGKALPTTGNDQFTLAFT